MRVLVPVEHLGPADGVAVQTVQVATQLAARGHQIDVVYLNGGQYEPDYRRLARTLHRVPALATSPRHPWVAARSVASAAVAGRRLRPDAVYDNLLWTLGASVTAAGRRAPVLCHVHGISEQLSRPVRALILRLPRVIAVSQFCAGQLRAMGVPDARIRVAHNGIDRASYPPADPAQRAATRAGLGIAPEAFVVLYLGRIHPDKGIDLLLDAVLRLAPDLRARTEVVLAGTSLDQAYLQSLRERGAGLRCHWLPACGDVLSMLHSADVLAAPSRWREPFGRVVIEAMAAGLPAIATRTGGIPEVLTGEFDRLLVEPEDTAGLAARLQAVSGWRSADPGLGARASAHVGARFGLDRMVDVVEEELVRALRPGHQG